MNFDNIEFGDIIQITDSTYNGKEFVHASILIISERSSKENWVKAFLIENQRTIDYYLPNLKTSNFRLIKGRE